MPFQCDIYSLVGFNVFVNIGCNFISAACSSPSSIKKESILCFNTNEDDDNNENNDDNSDSNNSHHGHHHHPLLFVTLQVAPVIKARMMEYGTTMVSYQPLGDKVNFFRMVISNPAATHQDIDFLIDEIERLGQDL